MTEPHQPLIMEDLDLGVSGNQVEAATGKRKAAEEAEAYERRRVADMERIWGRP